MKKEGLFIFLIVFIFLFSLLSAVDIQIISPLNNTFWNTNTLDINYTFYNASSCWYSNDTYSVNISIANCNNLTDIIWSEGQHNVTIWANDTSGNINTSKTSFTIDTILPSINFTFPTPANATIQSSNSVYVNVSTNDANEHSAFIDWNRSLIGWWAMDSYNSSGIYDNSSYNNFAKFYGGLHPGNITNGKRGKALSFDGINDYIQINNESIFDFTTNFTLEAWIKPRGTNTYNGIMSKYIGTATGWDWFLQIGKIRMTARGTSNIDTTQQGNDLRDGSWHHIVAVITNTYIQQYIDGVAQTKVIGNWTAVTNNASLAIGYRSGVAYFNGSMDEVRIYSRALSLEEVRASYQAGTYKLYHNFTSLTDGVYNYKAYAIDAAGNVNSTVMQQVTVDLPTSPNVVLNSPADGSTSSSDVVFNCSATNTNRNTVLSNITFYWDYSGLFTANSTIFTNSTFFSANFTETSLINKIITWNCYACDNASNCAFAAKNFTKAATTVYYVDAANGLDSNNGTSQSSAWKTISKVNAGSFNSGDSIMFKRGEMWREQLTIPSSGLSGNPIVFGAYGTGDNPIINPTEVISNWNVYSGNIYLANVTSSVTQVFVDGVFYNISFYPNTGFFTITNDSGKYGLVDANLTLAGDQIVGSTVKVMTANWAIEEKVASAYNDTTKTINWTSPTSYNVATGYGYYLENKLWMLDSPGKWWYNSSSKQVYIWIQGNDNPNNYNIEVSNQTYGIYATNKTYIHIANLTIKQTKDDSLYFEDVDNSKISNLNINDSGNRFIYIYNSRNLTLENTIGYRARVDGFRLYQDENISVINNSLYHLGMVGKPIRSYAGIWLWAVNNTLLQYNSLYDMGYIGIRSDGNNNIVDKNIVNRTCINLDDCGGIYTYFSNLSVNTISNNIVIDSIGAPAMKKAGIGSEAEGIYLDDSTSKFSVVNNTIINAGKGILVHNSFNNTITNNIVFNSRVGAIYILEDAFAVTAGKIRDNNISNNIFHVNSTSAVYPSGGFMGLLGSINFGSLDYNYYLHPYIDDIAVRVLNGTIITWDDYVNSYSSLYLWKQKTGQDNHSYDVSDFYKINNYKKPELSNYGSEGIINNNFDNNISNWNQWPHDWNMSWVSDCPIGEGGCLLVIHNDSEPITHVLYTPPFPIVQGQQYELRFKIKGNNTNSVLPVIRRNVPPYEDLGFRNPRLILSNQVINYSAIFTGITNVSNGRLDIEFATNGTAFWIDDIYVTQVNNITLHNQSNDFLLLYNAQTIPQTYTLNNNYMDIYENTISSPVVLQPYSSMLLLAGFCNYDDVCNNKETYSTCPSDCTNTNAGTGTTSSRGSTGGGITCTYDWVCSEWYPSPCPAEGIQKRVCVNKGSCTEGISGMPSLEQKCTPAEILPSQPLFDIFANIIPEYKWIIHQNETKFNVRLVNTGNATMIDVFLKYWITDEKGRLVAEKQETRAVGKNDEFQVILPIANLELGIYKTYVQITYGNNQIAIAEDSFQIVNSNFEIFLREAISFPYVIILFGSVIIILLIILLFRRKKKREEQGRRKKKIHIAKKGRAKNLRLNARKYLRTKKLNRIYRKRVRHQRRLERRNRR